MRGYPKVKGFFAEHGIKQKDVAPLLNMSLTTFNNKLNGNGDFTVGDVKILCRELGVKAEYFFTEYVPKSEQC